MRVLVACEESQAVTMAFRTLGHEAYSCDIQEPSGGHLEWHILGDALKAVEGGKVATMDGHVHNVGNWDMLIAHPPCTDLAVSGARWFAEKQKDGRQQRSIVFFMQMALANIPRVAVENPVCIMSSAWRKPDQIIHPWQFGHAEEKSTCLWLRGLPPLRETQNVREYMMTLPVRNRNRIYWLGGGHACERSKTFPGIARAMAEQWGGKISEEELDNG